MATRKMKRYDEGGMATPDRYQDGEANLAEMMGKKGTMERMPTISDMPPAREPIQSMMGRMPSPAGAMASKVAGLMGRMPTPQAQDTPPERIIGEPMERAMPMPMPPRSGGMRTAPGAEQNDRMVDAVKNIMARRGRQPIRARAMGEGIGGMAKGGSVSKASSRADGIAQRGKTRGKMC